MWSTDPHVSKWSFSKSSKDLPIASEAGVVVGVSGEDGSSGGSVERDTTGISAAPLLGPELGQAQASTPPALSPSPSIGGTDFSYTPFLARPPVSVSAVGSKQPPSTSTSNTHPTSTTTSKSALNTPKPGHDWSRYNWSRSATVTNSSSSTLLQPEDPTTPPEQIGGVGAANRSSSKIDNDNDSKLAPPPTTSGTGNDYMDIALNGLPSLTSNVNRHQNSPGDGGGLGGGSAGSDLTFTPGPRTLLGTERYRDTRFGDLDLGSWASPRVDLGNPPSPN